MIEQKSQFKKRIDIALDNAQLQKNFRGAMGYLREKRASQFSDDFQLQQWRRQTSDIRFHSLDNLPRLLETLEERLIENGIQVHWAEDAEQANQLIHHILTEANAKTVVKGKSMVSEEIHLNAYLEKQGLEVLETDLGEFIVQLAGEEPSHIVMPAIHQSKLQIAKLLHENFPEFEYTEDVDALTAMARKILRNKFEQADAGISGVNFAVAETGTLVLIENEGNGRMSTTVPPLHIAVTGIEKVVEQLSDVPPLINMLTKSATGQAITTYVNMISSPRRADELDGPDAVHLVLVDNGRTPIAAEKTKFDALKCIRCGSCINHCPVYVKLGGHAYGTTYPGPIGIALEPMKTGLDSLGTLTSACTLCGLCEKVCPVEIPLPRLINELRSEAVAANKQAKTQLKGVGSLRSWREEKIWSGWVKVYSSPRLLRGLGLMMTRFRFLFLLPLSSWHKYRKPQMPATRTLAELTEALGVRSE